MRVIFRLHELIAEESQSQLAHRAGCHLATAHRIYHNETRRVDLDVVGKLGEYTQMPGRGELFNRQGVYGSASRPSHPNRAARSICRSTALRQGLPAALGEDTSL